jgi:hypothetical protein
MRGQTELPLRFLARGFIIGLYVGLSLLFVLRTVFPNPSQRLLNFTNVYGLEAAAGAAITAVLIARSGVRSSREWKFSPAWITVGLALWAAGQIAWLKEAFIDNTPNLYPAPSDLCYLLSDLSFVIALVVLFSALGRRLVGESPHWGFIISLGVTLMVTLVLWLNRQSVGVLNVTVDLGYFFLTGFATLLGATLVQGDNRRLPAPLHRCLWYMFFAALLELLSTAAFIVTYRLPAGDPLKYNDGNWVDWLLLGAMTCWSLAALEYPIGRGLYSYSYGTLSQTFRSRGHAYRALDLAEQYLHERAGSPEMHFSADWTDWLMKSVPECWMIAMYGDETVGSTILIPLSENLKKRFIGGLSAAQVFEEVCQSRRLVWDWLYVAETVVKPTHKGRDIGFECISQTARQVRAKHSVANLLCRPSDEAGMKVARKLRDNLAGFNVEIL